MWCVVKTQFYIFFFFKQKTAYEIRAGHQLVIIVVSLAIGVPVVTVDFAHRGLQMIFVDVTCRNHLAILQRQKCVSITRPLHAPTHHPECYTLGRCSLRAPAQRARGDNGRSCDCESGCGDKTTPAYARFCGTDRKSVV